MTRRSATGAAAPEAAGWAAAAAVSVGVAAVAASASAELLFTDGDSLVVAMVVRSLALGQPQDWAMSPVLFLPEIGAFALLWALGLGVRATLLLNVIVNLLALYGALRLVAGARRPGRAPVAGTLAAFAVIAALALLEQPATRDGARFATDLLTTTYYSATTVAMIVCVGLIRRALDHLALPVAIPAFALAAISAVSVLSNPLFAAWLTVPAAVILAALAVASRVPRATAAALGSALVLGTGAGWAARGIFQGTIVAQGANYLHLGEVQRTAQAYGRALGELLTGPSGVLWLIAVAALWIWCIPVLVRAWRGGDAGIAFAAAIAAGAPPLLTVGAFAVGADAVRYLQPWLFLPVAALAAVAAARPVRLARRGVAVAVVGATAITVAIIATPIAVGAAGARDGDLACVTGWVQTSGRTGAGQFWTIRAPQAYAADPAALIQVDHTLRVYTWLTNRAIVAAPSVSFLVTDAASSPYELPAGLVTAQARAVDCGRYTILDFGERTLPLGPPRA